VEPTGKYGPKANERTGSCHLGNGTLISIAIKVLFPVGQISSVETRLGVNVLYSKRMDNLAKLQIRTALIRNILTCMSKQISSFILKRIISPHFVSRVSCSMKFTANVVMLCNCALYIGTYAHTEYLFT
jgi:hypothetical protein